MSHYYRTSFKTSVLFYLLPKDKTDPSQANGIWALFHDPLNGNITAFEFPPFCNHYNAKSFSFLISLFYLFSNDLDVIENFRNKNDISSSSHSRIESNPS